MNQIKIGKFIAECRKKNNLTQMQLAEKLNITDRAISKWENGKAMPDSSIMLDLCNELKISVNELLSGEVIDMKEYDKKSEELLLELTKKDELKNKKAVFKPSHTGSIIEKDGKLMVFDMKPMRATATPLANYLLHTRDKYALVIRHFKIDERMFSLNIAEHIGEFYPFMSAVRSVFTKRQTKWRTHCSELHLRELQKQGIKTELNPETSIKSVVLYSLLA